MIRLPKFPDDFTEQATMRDEFRAAMTAEPCPDCGTAPLLVVPIHPELISLACPKCGVHVEIGPYRYSVYRLGRPVGTPLPAGPI